MAEAWKQAQLGLEAFEHQVRARVPALEHYRLSAEAFKAALLTTYCANILHFQAALGRQTARQIPSEWMHMAAAAAVVSILHTALMLWLLQRPAPRPARLRRGPVRRLSIEIVPRVNAAPRTINRPLLC